MCFKKWRLSKDFLHSSQKWRYFIRYGKWRYKNGADNKVIILYNIIGGAMKKGAGNGATRSPVWIINKLCGDLLFLPRTSILVLL